MSLTIVSISNPVNFPDASPGQTAVRTLGVLGAVQPAPTSSQLTLAVEFNGETATTTVPISVGVPSVVLTAAADLVGDANVTVEVTDVRPREGTADRWYVDLLFTTV